MRRLGGEDRGQRVAVVLGEVDPEVVCGATRSFLRAAPELERRGWEIVYWTAVPSATQRELQASGAEVQGVEREFRFSLRQLRMPPGPRARLRGSLAAVRAFSRALAELDPDVVLGNTVGTLPELIVAHRRRLPTVLHVLEVVGGRPRHALGLRALSAVSDQIMVPSRPTARQFEALGRSPAVVPTGIEVPETAVRAADARLAERRTDELVVGAIGTISERKGSDLMVRAARILAERNPRVEVRMAGRPIEGAERARAERWIDEARAAGVAHVDRIEVFAELPLWDVLVVPSRRDPFPNVVLEALAIGVPVIGAAVDGIPDQIGDGAGILVPAGDPEAIASAVVRLAGDPDERRSLALAGRERAAALFSPQRQAEGTEAVLRAALRYVDGVGAKRRTAGWQ